VIHLLRLIHLLHYCTGKPGQKEGLMNMIAHRQLPPNAQDAAIARVSGQALSRYVRSKAPLKLRVTDADQAEPIELPASAVALLMDILEAMAAGRGITIIPESAELTTVQAAEVLNVSRPFLIKLLDAEKIPYRKVGKHRRIRMEDVMSYKTATDQDREAILDKLVAEAQEQDMGYGE
jgi:excisionase family DNA binding protein